MAAAFWGLALGCLVLCHAQSCPAQSCPIGALLCLGVWGLSDEVLYILGAIAV